MNDLQALREYEQRRARETRGFCNSCGHSWQPRNPNPTVNRCPGCGIRGMVKYDKVSTEPNKDAGSESVVDELQAAGQKGSRAGKARATAALKKRPVAIKVPARKKKG